MDELRSIRNSKRMTQKEAADYTGISLRSYISYENEEEKHSTGKYRYLVQELTRYNAIDEEHGTLTVDEIRDLCADVFDDYKVDCCILFGSYAKGKATGPSDVDLVISTETTGLKYYEMVERLRENLQKKVDLLDTRQLLNNEELLKEVLKDGIRIYG